MKAGQLKLDEYEPHYYIQQLVKHGKLEMSDKVLIDRSKERVNDCELNEDDEESS